MNGSRVLVFRVAVVAVRVGGEREKEREREVKCQVKCQINGRSVASQQSKAHLVPSHEESPRGPEREERTKHARHD